MAKVNLEKINKELRKADPDELYELFGKIKEYIANLIAAYQKEVEGKSNELASKIEKMK